MGVLWSALRLMMAARFLRVPWLPQNHSLQRLIIMPALSTVCFLFPIEPFSVLPSEIHCNPNLKPSSLFRQSL